MAHLFARFHRSLIPSLAALAGLLGGGPVSALELVPGGYGEALEAARFGEAAGERLEIGPPADAAAGVSLGFTPRHAVGALAPEEGGLDAGPRLDFAVRGGAGALDRLNLAEIPSALHPGSRGKTGRNLTVGGAMTWHGWSLGGGLGRADFLGTEVDLFSATLGYGRLSAEIAYGQSSDHEPEPRDVLMLSTDLAASSWLTLESDLAVGSRPDAANEDRSSVAVGRFGLRLNF